MWNLFSRSELAQKLNGKKAGLQPQKELKKTSSHNNIVREAKDAVKREGARVLLLEFKEETSIIHKEVKYLNRKHKIKVYYYFTKWPDKIFRNF